MIFTRGSFSTTDKWEATKIKMKCNKVQRKSAAVSEVIAIADSKVPVWQFLDNFFFADWTRGKMKVKKAEPY